MLNAIVSGLGTSQAMMHHFGNQLEWVEFTILGMFVIEVSLRIFVFRGDFFKKGWNIFDFLIIGASLFPHTAGFSILRSFRVLKSLHMFQISPHMTHIIQALRHMGPSALSVSFLMVIAFYIMGVLGVELFSKQFPNQFGTLPWSLFTLFRLMVYDDYGRIAQPILEAHPYAWVYFLVITIILAFVLINLFVAVVVTALQRAIVSDKDPLEMRVSQEMKMLDRDENTLNELKTQIQELKDMVKGLKESE